MFISLSFKIRFIYKLSQSYGIHEINTFDEGWKPKPDRLVYIYIYIYIYIYMILFGFFVYWYISLGVFNDKGRIVEEHSWCYFTHN